MSTHGFPPTVHVYDVGSLDVATLYQTWAWKALAVPSAAGVSISSVQPLGPLTVAGSASTSSVARSRSPAAAPAGLATVVPFVTLDWLRKLGGADVVVNVRSPDVLACPNASVLCTW